MQRMGLCIKLKPDVVHEYRRLHASVWPEVLAAVVKAHIRNYSIYLKEPENVLFAYWEYHGTDFAADAATMAQDEYMQAWWKICDPLQEPFETRQPGEWWARMPESFPHRLRQSDHQSRLSVALDPAQKFECIFEGGLEVVANSALRRLRIMRLERVNYGGMLSDGRVAGTWRG